MNTHNKSLILVDARHQHRPFKTSENTRFWSNECVPWKCSRRISICLYADHWSLYYIKVRSYIILFGNLSRNKVLRARALCLLYLFIIIRYYSDVVWMKSEGAGGNILICILCRRNLNVFTSANIKSGRGEIYTSAYRCQS